MSESGNNVIVSLVQRSFDDIPAMLEGMAATIRDGAAGEIVGGVGVFIDANGELTICGWGKDADDIRSAGLLTFGAAWLAANRVQR